MLGADHIRAFLEGSANLLEGRWLLIGGAMIALTVDPERSTEDIDLVPVDDSPGRRRQLLQAALQAGLGVEVVNSAADFFVKREAGWQEQLRPLLKVGEMEIFRPTTRLLVVLKAQRLSEQDLGDCLRLLDAEPPQGDWGAVLDRLDALDQGDDSEERRARRGALRAAINEVR